MAYSNGLGQFLMLYLAVVNQLQIFDAVFKGLFFGLYMAISVGPTLFAIIKYSMDNSHKAGLSFVLGVSLSDVIYVTIANLAAGWLKELDKYSKYISVGGGLLLIIIGAIGVFAKPTKVVEGKPITTIKGAHYAKIFMSGFLINTINPGVMLSWLGMVTTCANKTIGYRFILFAVCLVFILSIDFLKVFLAGKLRVYLTPKRLVQVQKASSFIILALGIVLLVHTLL